MKSKKNDGKTIKNVVKQRYAELVTSGEERSCCDCGSSCCAPPPETKGTFVKMAGYSEDELASLPAGAVENSFGCGNPLAFSGVEKGQTVLDLGSGAGIDCFIAAKKVGETGRVIGLDMTEEMIEKARANATEGGYSNTEFRLGEMESMPVEDGSVDWIISNCVINLSPDKPKVFGEMFRVLKPGGRFSVSDIVLGDALPDVIAQSMHAWTGCIAGAIKESDYIEGLREKGFREVAIESRYVYEAGMIKSIVQKYASELMDSLSEDILDSIDGKIWSAKVVGLK